MVLQEFFNICLMNSLQLLDLCVILLSCASRDILISTQFAEFTCDKVVLATFGENVTITCNSTKEIIRVIVKFYHHNNYPEKVIINTTAEKYADDNGRISLKKDISSVYLYIHNVEIADHGIYNFCLKANTGHDCLPRTLQVNAPYTMPEVRQQNDTTIVCSASKGYPKRQLYWYDVNGTNLTHSSKLQDEKAGDGSFLLSSTLQVESPVGEMQYCCSFNNTTCSDTRQDSVWITVRQTTMSAKLKSEEHTASPLILIAIVGALVIGVAVLYYLYKRKKGANDVHWPRGLTAFHHVSIFKWVEEEA